MAIDAKKLSDYFPDIQAKLSRHGTVLFTLVIGPDAKVVSCGVTTAADERDFNNGACGVAFFNAKYKPAIDVDGRPIYGVRFKKVLFSYEGEGRRRTPSGAQLQIYLAQMPAGLRDPQSVDADVVVNAAGKVEQCLPRETKPATAGALLGRVACQQIAGGWTPLKVEVGGKPQRSVQTIGVTFSAKPPSN